MSIPRIAIHRPVTMFMLSAVIVMLGAISLSKLPVDLMPEFAAPVITVNTTYANVGPLEIEELITRPIEQSVSAVAGITRVESSSREGGSNVRLFFGWGANLAEAADDVRSRLDRVRGRLPEEADPPVIFKADSNAFPIMQIGVEGDYDPVTLREIAENDLSPRLERAPGVAAVTINGGLRRQIHVDLSKEKITALNLSVDRIIQALRSENQNLPLGQIDQGDSTYLVRSQGQFNNIDDIRNLVVMTRENVPVYMRDIADVTDSTEDRRQFQRITSRDASGKLGEGHAAVRMQINKQSGENTVAVAQGIRDEVARINRDVPGVRLLVLDDNAIFIERAINNVKEHALVGGILVVLIIFAFLRDFRSTLIVCTSIPVSVIGTFALLYFGGFTLNTMTFGGLALGIGMIVDAAIVVLENKRQRPHDRGDRRQRGGVVGDPRLDADAYRRVRPAALPAGHLEHSVHTALVRRHVLARDVAVRRGDDRAGALLALAAYARRTSAALRCPRPFLSRERTISGAGRRRVPACHPHSPPASADRDWRGGGAGRARRRPLPPRGN
jgi:hydrophobic/amphiphilic exporter-1 (mainly G- bacteria), HAE1 family